MTDTPLRTDWAALKRRLQEMRPELQDEDLPPPGSHPEELVWHLQRRLGTDVEEAQALFDEANQSNSGCPAR